MEAPDKLFLHETKVARPSWHHGRVAEGDVEYIRKNALLEWLNNEIERYNDKLIQPSNNKEEAIQIASSISSLLVVIAKLETL